MAKSSFLGKLILYMQIPFFIVFALYKLTKCFYMYFCKMPTHCTMWPLF